MKIEIKFKNFKKILIFLVFIFFAVSNTLAVFSANNLKEQELKKLDNKINQIFDDIYQNPNSQLSIALYELKKSNLDIEASVITEGGNQSIIIDSQLRAPKLPQNFSSKSSNSRQIIGTGQSKFAGYKLPLLGGGTLVVLTPLSNSESIYRSTLKSNLLNYNLIAVGSSLLIFFFYVIYRNYQNENHIVFMQNHLSDIAHELRTPLTVIKGYSELLERNLYDKSFDSSKAMMSLRREVLRMETLISDLLFLSEIREKIGSAKSKIDVSSIARTHFEDFVRLHPTHSTELIAPNNAFISANSDHIDRLFQNILSNIVRHTSEISDVKCSISNFAKNVLIHIEDSGPGLHPKFYKDQNQALNRFDSSRSKTAGGSGLGLNIIYAIVRENGGDLIFEKSSLGGLGIKITFPGI
ncbi:MAG: hypothetical protein RLZ57_400 [Actinomycetota bacterium]